MNYDLITTVFRELAIKGAAEIMDVYGQDDFGVRSKDDEGIRAAFPEITLVTEEQSDSHSLNADTFIIVDPLDGTKEFINRRGDFTVDRMFWTDASGQSVEETGPFGDKIGETKPMSVTTPGEELTVVASKSHRDQATDDYIAKYKVGAFQSAGSSLKFCLVASGEADIYPRVGRTMEWDTAAGHAVLNGAGGAVVRFDDHTPLTYGKADYANPFFIAYAPGVDLKPA